MEQYSDTHVYTSISYIIVNRFPFLLGFLSLKLQENSYEIPEYFLRKTCVITLEEIAGENSAKNLWQNYNLYINPLIISENLGGKSDDGNLGENSKNA